MEITGTRESKLNDSPGFNFLQVDSALAPGYPEDPLVEGFRATLKQTDLATLSNLNWRKCCDHNSISGNDRKECPFYRKIAEFYGYRPKFRLYATSSGSGKADWKIWSLL